MITKVKFLKVGDELLDGTVMAIGENPDNTNFRNITISDNGQVKDKVLGIDVEVIKLTKGMPSHWPVHSNEFE